MENVLATGLVCYSRKSGDHVRVEVEYDLHLIKQRSPRLLDYLQITNKTVEQWQKQKGLIRVQQKEVLLYC